MMPSAIRPWARPNQAPITRPSPITATPAARYASNGIDQRNWLNPYMPPSTISRSEKTSRPNRDRGGLGGLGGGIGGGPYRTDGGTGGGGPTGTNGPRGANGAFGGLGG